MTATLTTKRHLCGVCDRNFARSEHLKRHITTHTHEKSFQCYCGKSFGRRDLLKRHERVGKHLTKGLTTPDSLASSAVPSPITVLDIVSHTGSTLLSFTKDGGATTDVPSALDDPLYGEWFSSNAFQNFDAFISTMGLDAPFYNVLPDTVGDHGLVSHSQGHLITVSQVDGSSLPPDCDPANIHELKRIPCAWTVTQRQWDVLEAALQPYERVLHGFTLPSALAISRYLTGYMEDFHNHQPILHTATYRPQESSESPELVLAICTNGALTRYERQSALRLFRASKAIIDIQWSRRDLVASCSDQAQGREQYPVPSSQSTLRIAQAALLLATFAIMEGTHGLLHEAASLHSVIVEYVRDHRITMDHMSSRESWQDWIHCESGRRTQCAIFNILNMYTMALDSAPALPCNLLEVHLPCSTLEWIAGTPDDWWEAKRFAPSPVTFKNAYSALFDISVPHTHLHAPLGNLVLINAILQRIWLARQLQLDNDSESLRSADLDEIEVALDRWTHAWKQAPESILDPRNPDASNSFTSTSYLGLAYVRLHSTYGARRRLCDWQPKSTGSNLHRAPGPQRTPRIEPALLHAAQAFAIPVKYGIEYLGRKQFHYWDLQNFIWHLEAAIFLSKWFSNIAETRHCDPLSEFESRLISVVNNLVDKAEESIEPNLFSEQNQTRSQTAVDTATSLSRRVARLWACLYHKQNSPWGLVDMIGRSLAEYERLTAEIS